MTTPATHTTAAHRRATMISPFRTAAFGPVAMNVPLGNATPITRPPAAARATAPILPRRPSVDSADTLVEADTFNEAARDEIDQFHNDMIDHAAALAALGIARRRARRARWNKFKKICNRMSGLLGGLLILVCFTAAAWAIAGIEFGVYSAFKYIWEDSKSGTGSNVFQTFLAGILTLIVLFVLLVSVVKKVEVQDWLKICCVGEVEGDDAV